MYSVPVRCMWRVGNVTTSCHWLVKYMYMYISSLRANFDHKHHCIHVHECTCTYMYIVHVLHCMYMLGLMALSMVVVGGTCITLYVHVGTDGFEYGGGR